LLLYLGWNKHEHEYSELSNISTHNSSSGGKFLKRYICGRETEVGGKFCEKYIQVRFWDFSTTPYLKGRNVN